MIKNAISNYFKCLKYVFTPIGTLFLGILIGLSVFISGMIPAIDKIIADINSLSSDISLDFKGLADEFSRIVRQLDWSNPTDTVSQILSKEWIGNTLTECLSSLLGVSYQTYVDIVTQSVAGFIDTVAVLAAVFVFFVIIGLVGGYLLTKLLVRRTIAKRTWWKVFLSSLLDSILSAAAVIVMVVLIGVWQPSIIISPIVMLLLYGIIALVEAYVVHAYKKLKLKEVLTAKNVLLLFASNLIILLIAMAVSIIAFALFKALTGLVLSIALFEIAMLTASMNAEAYVKSRVEK